MPERRMNPTRLALVCYILASYLFLVFLMAAMGFDIALAGPGIFLFDRFHIASLYVPILFLVSGVLVKSGRLPKRTMLLLWISPILFLTSAVMFQTARKTGHPFNQRMIHQRLAHFERMRHACAINFCVDIADERVSCLPHGRELTRLFDHLMFVRLRQKQGEFHVVEEAHDRSPRRIDCDRWPRRTRRSPFSRSDTDPTRVKAIAVPVFCSSRDEKC